MTEAAENTTTPAVTSLPPLLANGVATATAFTLFFVAIGRLGASRTAVVMTIEAVSAVVLTALFLGETVQPLEALGGVAVLAGAAIASFAGRPRAVGLEEAP